MEIHDLDGLGALSSIFAVLNPLTRSTLIYHDQSSSKLVNDNKQPRAKKLANDFCSYNLLVVGPLTIKLGTLINHKNSSKQKSHVIKQPQAIK